MELKFYRPLKMVEYIKARFVRALVMIKETAQHATREVVPQQDFTAEDKNARGGAGMMFVAQDILIVRPNKRPFRVAEARMKLGRHSILLKGGYNSVRHEEVKLRGQRRRQNERDKQ